jgi:hypothetical protein
MTLPSGETIPGGGGGEGGGGGGGGGGQAGGIGVGVPVGQWRRRCYPHIPGASGGAEHLAAVADAQLARSCPKRLLAVEQDDWTPNGVPNVQVPSTVTRLPASPGHRVLPSSETADGGGGGDGGCGADAGGGLATLT